MVNESGQDYVGYCWSEVPGYSKFGKYTGTGVAGNFIHTGFKPAWVLIKRTDSTDNWYMYDNKRDGIQQNQLTADISDAEYLATDYPGVDLLSNGFTLLDNNPGRNGNGSIHIYMAFAELPQQYLPQ